MMMRAGARRGLDRHRTCPQFARTGVGVRDRRRARHAGGLRSVGVQLSGANDADSVLFPIGHTMIFRLAAVATGAVAAVPEPVDEAIDLDAQRLEGGIRAHLRLDQRVNGLPGFLLELTRLLAKL